VTHDVNEAVTLADRILVMDKDPGRVQEEIHVDLKRPRKKESREFLYYSQYLYAILRR
jgi:NitT/TauT family transport system ATP-binding protein